MKYEGYELKLDQIEENRSVSTWKQFSLLFERNVRYILKNPASVRSIFFNSIFSAFLIVNLFWKVGDIDKAKNESQAVYNWVGFSFMMCNTIMFPAIF